MAALMGLLDKDLKGDKMNDRIKTAALILLVVLFFLVPAAFYSAVLLAGAVILLILLILELYYALRRRLKPISFFSLIIGSATALLPSFIWLAFADYASWFNLPLRSSGLSAELLQNNIWRSYYVWMLGLGFALYAFCFCCYALIAILLQVLRYGPSVLPQAGATVLAALYLSFPFASLVLLSFAVPNGYKWLWLLILLVSTTDIAAYYGGKKWGKIKFIKQISPNKTLEGCICGLVASAIVAAIYMLIFMVGPQPQISSYWLNALFGLLAGFAISCVAQLGDWYASAIKRWVRLKNFSKILPGHGGILDRLDSYMFALPTAIIVSFIYYMSKFN